MVAKAPDPMERCMFNRKKFWLKVAFTLLFVALEVFTFRHSVITAFEQPSAGAVVRAVGSQLSLVLCLGFLWFGGRTRISEDAGWGALALFTLIVSLP